MHRAFGSEQMNKCSTFICSTRTSNIFDTKKDALEISWDNPFLAVHWWSLTSKLNRLGTSFRTLSSHLDKTFEIILTNKLTTTVFYSMRRFRLKANLSYRVMLIEYSWPSLLGEINNANYRNKNSYPNSTPLNPLIIVINGVSCFSVQETMAFPAPGTVNNGVS